jgi:hypothetical protein
MVVKDWNKRDRTHCEEHVLYQVFLGIHAPVKYDVIRVDEPSLSYLSTVSDRFIIRFLDEFAAVRYIYTLPKFMSCEEMNRLAEELFIIIKLMS